MILTLIVPLSRPQPGDRKPFHSFFYFPGVPASPGKISAVFPRSNSFWHGFPGAGVACPLGVPTAPVTPPGPCPKNKTLPFPVFPSTLVPSPLLTGHPCTPPSSVRYQFSDCKLQLPGARKTFSPNSLLCKFFEKRPRLSVCAHFPLVRYMPRTRLPRLGRQKYMCLFRPSEPRPGKLPRWFLPRCTR